MGSTEDGGARCGSTSSDDQRNDPRDDHDVDTRELEHAIRELVCAPIVPSSNGFSDSDVYLARSWLGAIHSYVRRQQGDTHHADRIDGDQRRLLVAIANRLDLDVERLLAADPHEEVRTIYEALSECENGQEDRASEGSS